MSQPMNTGKPLVLTKENISGILGNFAITHFKQEAV